MVKRWTRLLVFGAVACVLALSAWAQTSTTGVIEGRVRDQAGNPVKDATVMAVANRAPATSVVDAQGRFQIQNLPPGTYKVRAEAPGKAAVVQDEIIVSINTRSRVDFTLVAGQTETVTVTAEAPVVDTKSVTTGGSFKVESFIDQVPIGRNLAATLTLAPGVVSGGGTGAGNYSISGSSGLENSYIVDGVNITSTGYGGIGTYNQVYGSLGIGVTYDFLEEVQVKTGGIDVEYGQATGGVVNTVVKTGTNDISGGVAFFSGAPVNEFKQASLFTGAFNSQKGTWNDNAKYDVGLSVGGPIVKDKLFYFLAYNPVQGKDTGAIENIPLPSNLAGDIEGKQFSSYPAADAGNQTRKRTSNNYAAKLTWYANPNHRLEISAFGDPSKGDLGPQRFSLRNLDWAEGGGISSIDYGANNYTLKYDAVFTPSFFMQAQIGRHDGKFNEVSALNKSRFDDQRQLRCFLSPNFCAPGQSRDNAAIWRYGGVGFFSDSKDVNNQAKVTLTWVKGNNELKGGASYDDVSYTDQQNYTGDNVPVKFQRSGGHCSVTTATFCTATSQCPAGESCVRGSTANMLATPCPSSGPPYFTNCYVNLDLNGGLQASERQSTAGTPSWRATRGRFNPNPGPTKTKDLAVFLQDTWTFTPKWTLKAGLRASQQKISGTGSYTLDYHYADGTLESQTEPTTPGDYKFEWAYAPRVGLTWDTKGDGRSKVYLNAARYYERVPNDLAIRALSNEADLGTTTFAGWDTVTGMPTNQASAGRLAGGQTRVEDGTKLPYVDELVLGWQQEIGRDISVEVRGIYRQQGRALEDTQFATVEATENYYAYAFFGTTANGDIDTVPFPNDPALCSIDPVSEICVPDPNGTIPGTPFQEYVLANPSQNTPAGFPAPTRVYQALELVLNKRFGNHWQFYGNMRFSRLYGRYEGLFRNDNGQSDPNISSLYDFPDSPLLHGQFLNGPLNTDVPYSMKLYGNYRFDNGINLGAAYTWAGGVPRTPLLAHPSGFYQNSGEVPGISPVYYWYSATDCADTSLCLTTGTADAFFRDAGAFIPNSAWSFPHLYSYNQAKRGFLGRTSDLTSLDLSISWQKKFSRWATFGVGATVFNVLNFRETQGFDDNVEFQAGVTDPDYGKPLAFQTPRSVRMYARWSF